MNERFNSSGSLRQVTTYDAFGTPTALRWSHAEHVDLLWRTVFAGEPSVWLLVQLPRRDVPAVEVRLAGVVELAPHRDRETEATKEFNRDAVALCLSPDRASQVVASRREYQMRGVKCLGPDPDEGRQR